MKNKGKSKYLFVMLFKIYFSFYIKKFNFNFELYQDIII